MFRRDFNIIKQYLISYNFGNVDHVDKNDSNQVAVVVDEC